MKNLYGYIDKKPIIERISFILEKGEVLGVVGQNGAGKTTLLRSIAMLIESKGEIILNGENVKKMSRIEIARKISFLPQTYNVFKGFTVLDTITSARYASSNSLIFDTEEDIQIALNSLKETGIVHLKDRYVSDLSSGEKELVLIARSLVNNADLILLDEPISHLDIKNQFEVLQLIKKIVTEQKKMAIITFHDVNRCREYSDKVLMMKNGKVFAFGESTEVLTQKNIEACYDLHFKKKLFNSKFSAHIICGGGSGSAIMEWLYENYVSTTVGIISPLDSDYVSCKKYGFKCLLNDAFSNIPQKLIEEHKKMIENADIVILTDFPVGDGNISNLSILENYKGKLYMLEKSPAEERDYTSNHILPKIWKNLKERAVIYKSELQLIEAISSKPPKGNVK
ncbi:MAG: ABC transporter ATP-binding protein [Thermoplasmata archaeon]